MGRAAWLIPVLAAWLANHALRIAVQQTDGGRIAYVLNLLNPVYEHSHLGLELALVGLLSVTAHSFMRRGLLSMALVSTLIVASYCAAYLHFQLLGVPATFDRFADVPELLAVAPALVTWPAGLCIAGLMGALLFCARPPTKRIALLLPASVAVAGLLAARNPARAIEVIDTATPYELTQHTATFYRSGPIVYALREQLRQLDIERQLASLDVRAPTSPFDGFAQALAAARPTRNVHVVLLESHLDPRDFSALGTFNRPPVDARYAQLRDAAPSHALAPVVGGRTANTELEVLCGVPAYETLGAVAFNHFSGTAVPCLPRLLAAIGYRTTVRVPTPPAYFNAVSAYRAMGFTDRKFFDAFDMSDRDGTCLSMQSVFHQALAAAATPEAKQAPHFDYVVTIAGHFPFDLAASRPALLETDKGLGAFHGVVQHSYYTSVALADYVEQLQRTDPNSLIVMFSDHVPPVPEADYRRAGYHGSGYHALALQLRQVPLIIIDRGKPVSVGTVPHYALTELIVDRLSDGAYCAKHECQGARKYALRPPFVVDSMHPTRHLCTTFDKSTRPECVDAARLDRELTDSFLALINAAHRSESASR